MPDNRAEPRQTEPVRRRRTKPAEIRLDELMNAAEALFLSQGVEATTIEQIVERAQVAKGTFYHYFSAKTQLLDALAQRYTSGFLQRLETAVQALPADDWSGRLRAWIEANVRAYAETYRVHDVVYQHHHQHDRANADKNAILAHLLVLLDGGAAAGLWQLAQPRVTALLIYAGVHAATDELIVGSTSDTGAFIEALVDSCLCLVAGSRLGTR